MELSAADKKREYARNYMRTYYVKLRERDPELAKERQAKKREYGKEYQRAKRAADPTVRERDRVAAAKRRQENPAKAREISKRSKARARVLRPHLHTAQWLWWAYRMKPEQYAEMLKTQNGVCAFCYQGNGDAKLVVDHDHNKPKGEGNRWLLCTQCNLLIANARENPQVLRAAASKLEEYLKR